MCVMLICYDKNKKFLLNLCIQEVLSNRFKPNSTHKTNL